MKKVVNAFGVEVNFEMVVNLMDDEIREEIHSQLAPCTEQEFFDAYCAAHEKQFGEDFEPNKANPCW